MLDNMRLIPPSISPPLDEDFRPAVLANRYFRSKSRLVGVPLVIGLERSKDEISCFETIVFPEDHPEAGANYKYVERLVKFLLWQRGGYRIYIGGSRNIGELIQECYAHGGPREFDYHFMGEKVYEQTFEVIPCDIDEVPEAQEIGKPIGRNLDGYRIGFDLGASDRKASAVVDGAVIYSEEVVWEPREHDNPSYHYESYC